MNIILFRTIILLREKHSSPYKHALVVIARDWIKTCALHNKRVFPNISFSAADVDAQPPSPNKNTDVNASPYGHAPTESPRVRVCGWVRVRLIRVVTM